MRQFRFSGHTLEHPLPFRLMFSIIGCVKVNGCQIDIVSALVKNGSMEKMRKRQSLTAYYNSYSEVQLRF